MVLRQAVIQASLGDIDNTVEHTPQTVPYDYHLFTSENFPLRDRVMLPRLQAKIPKFFGWQLRPNYDYYLWLDGNISLNNPSTIKYLQDQIQDHDIVVLRHPDRPNIRQEVRYTRKGVNQQSRYVVSRYTNEWLKEIYEVIENDKDYIDDLLVIGGIFMYRNTPKVQAMMKEWWYYNSRYIVQDQISFPYVLKKNSLKVKVLDHSFKTWDYIKITRHTRNDT